LIPTMGVHPRGRKRWARTQAPPLGRAPRERRFQTPTGVPLPTNQWVGRRRILGFLRGEVYQGSKLPYPLEAAHRDATGPVGFWSVGVESERFRAV